MVGLLVVAHGRIAESFIEVAQAILGELDGVQAISLADPLDEKAVLKEIQRARKQIDYGEGILILTDMFGGTPANLCFSLIEDDQIEVLTGMNLPMILKILTSHKKVGLAELARMAKDCGQENIYFAREILEQRSKNLDGKERS